MKRTIIVVIFLLFLTLSAFASRRTDSLLLRLDEAIKKREMYQSLREKRISDIKTSLQETAQDDETGYRLYGELFEAYKNYQMDSALLVANRRISLAEKTGNPAYRVVATMNLAEVMAGTGMYKEAFDILDNQSRDVQSLEILTYRYHLYHSLYVLMRGYSISEKQKQEYRQLAIQYKDSILNVLSEGNMGYQMVKATRLLADGQTGEALEIALRCYDTFGGNDQSAAMSAYTVAEVYNQMGEREKEKEFLAVSALGDIRGAVKEYISLRALASMLYDDGDISRAYDYTKFSMEDAIFCNARLRALEIAEMLPIINESYDLKMLSEKKRLAMLLAVISLLSLFLAIAIVYIYKQLKALSVARKRLKQINSDLEEVNSNLNKLNHELSESNIVKEEYIGYVFTICSDYIDKLEDFRKKTNRKLRTGQIDELVQMTSSSSLVSDELKEFHRSFDTIFLKLYPKFVGEFNSLLLPGEAIIPKEGELLSPELRIFALIRLGIPDSAKIADFLHYSTQTVYNYRLKVRNKLRISKDDFSEAVRRIGRTD